MTSAANPEKGAVGLREMHLTEQDIAELQRHIDHPSAFPTLLIRSVPEADPDELLDDSLDD